MYYGPSYPWTFRWYRCHGCCAEYLTDVGRSSRSCNQCWQSDLHIHSDGDGELPCEDHVLRARDEHRERYRERTGKRAGE